ncbi:MAG: glycosyltransferase family 39 protein, partial [Anaerolineales bacterium]|nr:glycosyltransferase family 39 protein [Anaerolineales bacterium]
MKGRDRGLMVIVAAHLLLGAVYAWATPIFEAPDEGYHVAVTRWIAQGRGLPVQVPGVDTDYEQEGSQPPLYYLLGAGLIRWVDTSDWEAVFIKNPRSRIGIPGTTHNVNDYRPAPAGEASGTRLAVYLLRAFSLLLNAGTLLLADRLARGVFADAAPRYLALALIAFNPMMLFIGAAANNDNLLRLLTTAGLLLSVKIAAAKPTPAHLAGLGVVLGLGALAKLSGLVLWPLAALAVIWGAGRPRFNPWSVIRQLGLVFGLALAICGWWYLRNWQLYGDPTGLNAMIAIAGPRAVSVWQVVTQEWYGFYISFWALFGVFTILPAAWVQVFFHALTGLLIVGGALAIGRRRGRFTFPELALAAFCALTLAGVIRWTMQTPASQGRLLFGALAPLALGMAAGWLALFPARWARPAAVGLAGALAVVAAVIPIADIAPRYAPPPALAEADLPADLQPVHARLGEGIELVGYTSDPAPRRPGEAQAVTLYWRALQTLARDDTLTLVLFGRGGQPVGQLDTWPGAGRLPTGNWQAGAYYADPYLLPIAAGAPAPTLLKLSVSAWAATPADRLPVRGPDGAPLDAVTVTVGRLIPAAAPAATPAVTDGSRFEYDLVLLGYDAVMAHTPGAGGTLRLTLYWRAGQALPADYTVFAHLVDAQGAAVAPPADAPP